jgi:hypothetical protein
MSESEERHQTDEFAREEDQPDVEGHLHDEFSQQDEAAEKGQQDEAAERHRHGRPDEYM